ncbi:MAG: radical SAM family heme chaperone HemW [Endomicrobiia bacterium]|nr:radical SAM family heme chaperone HemW [Endomicrobiia bacterium]
MAGLYVHIPFCRSKCHYCDFASAAVGADVLFASSGREALYLDALAVEAASRRETQRIFDTVYIGGGTPSAMSVAGIKRLFEILRRGFDMSGDSEVTFECNPESVSAAKLRALADCGVTRISIGAQSFDDETLAYLGRIHSATATKKAFAAARQERFDNIGIDLLFGAPVGGAGPLAFAMCLEKWRRDLEEAVALGPEHISVYALSVEEGTPLAARGVEISEDEQEKMYDIARCCLKSRGYVHYEISNFALQGKESRHNLNYWRQGKYLGLGCSSASFDGKTRFKNSSSMKEYLANPADCVVESECLSDGQLASERIFLGLRMLDEGARIGEDDEQRFSGVMERLEKEGSVSLSGGRLRLASGAIFMSNAVMREFV